MIRYTRGFVNLLSFIISIIIFIIINNTIFMSQIVQSNFNSNQLNGETETNSLIQETNTNSANEKILENSQNTNNTSNSNNTTKESSNYKWSIEIPAINLKAQIEEGTTKEVMDAYVAHFTETSKEKGNIGLAAHNRGYKVNYFQDLKKLKTGDEIIYKYNKFKKTYVVETIKIIKDTDWTYLEETEENKITLITCVENEPEYRRCVQGIEK